ncbi:MAG: hypothetical protein ACYCT0_11225 [Sulfobacillus sp.]
MSEFSDVQGSHAWHGTNFRRILERLLGDTVSIQTNDSAFVGKLADVETTFVTLASARHTTSAHVALVYIPVRHINAVTEL